MDDAETQPYLMLSGFSIYSQTSEALTAILPATVTIQVNSGTPRSYNVRDASNVGAYSPSGNWMPYFAAATSGDQIAIPGNGEAFTITVTVTPHSGTALSFTEHCCGTVSNSITCPDRIYTGRAYEFIFNEAVEAVVGRTTTAELTWYPKMDNYFTTQVYEVGWLDPYTPVSEAVTDFYSFYFAVANRDGLPGSEAAHLTTDANITIQTHYASADFTDGILITEILATVPTAPRDEVDAELAPTLTANDITLTVAPAAAEIGGKFCHRQATVTCVPVAQYKYGDSLSYIHFNDMNRYGDSISFQAEGIEPGTSYVRPDTGATVTAGNESIRNCLVSVYGGKWKQPSATVNKCYTVLWCHAPRLEFSLHRCSVSSSATSYRYDGVYYKKDDYGAYCLIEYTVNFAPLANTNTTEMIIQHGTHRITLHPSYTQSSFVVVSAPAEQTLDVIIGLYDLFYPYGVVQKQTLSTGTIIMDILNGGRGIAIGKNATVASAVDIDSNWKLLFFKATVAAYNGSRQDLIAWMHSVDSRLTTLENTRYANG